MPADSRYKHWFVYYYSCCLIDIWGLLLSVCTPPFNTPAESCAGGEGAEVPRGRLARTMSFRLSSLGTGIGAYHVLGADAETSPATAYW